MTTAYKVFTSRLCPPVQGGAPVWGGDLPYTLPVVDVDVSAKECSHGWGACALPEDAVRIAGLWPDGRPSRLYRVETDAEVIERGDKLRASTWTICEEIDAEPAIRALSQRWFGDLADVMADEQLAWRAALARPQRNEAIVEQGLALALDARGLQWSLKRFRSARDARAAWAARDARDAWAARAARAARDAWDAWAAWDARDAWAARAARDAWDAWDALRTQYAARRGWISCSPDRHTVGIRDAYHAGLAIALPTGPDELGWAMEAP